MSGSRSVEVGLLRRPHPSAVGPRDPPGVADRPDHRHHQASRQTYRPPRVRAELVQGQGVVVSRKTVAVLMQRAGLAGLPLRRRAKRVPTSATVTDLVKRDFRRDGPNQLWVTDITEH